MLHDQFAVSFIPFAGIIFLMIFLRANTTMDSRLLKTFFLLAILEFCELTFFDLELWTSTFAQPGFWRMLFSALGYTVRIASIYLFLLLSLRGRTTRRSRLLWAIPAIWNALVAFSVFFTDISYYFTPDNHFERGVLGYTPHIVFFFYLVGILIVTVKGLCGRAKLESLTIAAIAIFISGSVMISTIFAVEGLGCAATVFSTIFYYMFFQTQVYQENMTEEQRSRQIFEAKSKTDGMTDLLNKSAFLDEAGMALRTAGGKSVALIFLDMDYFKTVNDQLGHLVGDSLLRDCAKKLQNVFRNADIIGRFGGDEFCVFLRDIPREVLRQRLDEVLASLQAVYSSGAVSVDVTASAGAVYCTNGEDTELQTLLRLADEASYRAKSLGRNHYVIHDLPPAR